MAKTAAKEQVTGTRRPGHDWEAIERDYSTGRFTDTELASKHGNGLTREGVSRRRKKDQAKDPSRWQRDLQEHVRRATNALLAKEEVTAQITAGHAQVTSVILSAAEVNKQVILEHRSRARRAAEVARGILEELAAAAALDGDRELIAAVLAGEQADAKALADARDAIQRALGVGARAATVQKLMDALGKAQAMEERAYKLDDTPPAPPAPVDLSSVPPERAMEAYLAWAARR